MVYYEVFEQIDLAISREKQIKGLLRIKKIQLIEEFNCGWCDLCPDGRVILPERISVNHKNA